MIKKLTIWGVVLCGVNVGLALSMGNAHAVIGWLCALSWNVADLVAQQKKA